jgi:hypothetical protein
MSLSDIVLLGILGAAFHYLSYRATITRWLWSRYPKPVDALLSCCACTSFWIGGAVGYACKTADYPLLGLSGWILLPACALVAMIAAPPVAFLHTYSLMALAGEAPSDDVGKS